jgi:hypothetical protein
MMFQMTPDQYTRHEVTPYSRNRADNLCDYRLHCGLRLHLQIQVLSWENSQWLTSVR